MPRVCGEGPKRSEHALTDGRAAARLVWLGTGDGKNKDILHAGLFQHRRTRRDCGAGSEHVVNQQHALRGDRLSVANREGISDAFAAGARIHAGAVASRLNPTHDAVFIERQVAEAREFASEHSSLVETALAFASGMKRNSDDQVSAIDRLALQRRKHQVGQMSSDMRFTFQLQH